MEDYSDFDKLTLTIFENKISSFLDKSSDLFLKSFHKRLTKKNVSKIYVIKHESDFLYVGTTTQSLSSRFRYGLKADGKNGYHGYKWKRKESVDLYAWCFDTLSKIEIENIEAELVFLIRTKTGKWPQKQNEIHFNNEFDNGKGIAEKMFVHIN
jgi:hypothetical protein